MGILTAFKNEADFTGISESAVNLHFEFISQYAAINIQADGANGASWIDGSFDYSKSQLNTYSNSLLNTDVGAHNLKLSKILSDL